MTPDSPEPLLDRLKRRKIFQWAIAYAGGAWLLLQLLSLVAQPFAWPDLVLRAAIVVLVIGFFGVLVIAWFHGEKGQQKASGIELLMLAALFILAAAGVAIVARDDGTLTAAPQATEPALANDRSIVVLPFTNMSADPENEYFSDGMTEDVLTNLSKINDLRVISRTSAMSYKGTQKKLPEIARELNVSHVLEGSVRRAGNRVLITAQLIKADGDQHIWSENYQRDISDIFAVQAEISRAIADALKAKLSPSEGARLATRPTESIEAYDLYMKGRDRYLRFRGNQLQAAIADFQKAVAIDPGFGLAWAGLARTYLYDSENRVRRDSAETIAKHAIALSPNSADAHAALGEVYRTMGRYGDALQQYRQALALEPNHAISIAETAQTLGSLGMGRLAESIQVGKRAIAADPAQSWFYYMQGDAYWQLGLRDRAKEHFNRGRRIDPAYPYNTTSLIKVALADGDTAAARELGDQLIDISNGLATTRTHVLRAFAESGDRAGALRVAQAMPDSVAAHGGSSGRLLVYWLQGDKPRLISAANELVQTHQQLSRTSSEPRPHLQLALAAIARGDRSEALTQIESYAQKGGRDAHQLRSHLLFATLQNEPRLVAVLQRIDTELKQQRAGL